MTGRLYRSERFKVFRCLLNCPIRTYVRNPSPISICYRGQPKRIIQGELKTIGKAGEGKINIRYKAPSKLYNPFSTIIKPGVTCNMSRQSHDRQSQPLDASEN